MATGLSLVCGDCGAQLRSTQEAQDHAEATSHTNFAESTEPVLNLVCSECGKPCRSKTETDLHTKRTGHTGFTDKTEETAKPIELDPPPAAPAADAGGSGAEVDGAPGGAEGEGSASPAMVVPEVSKELQAELEGMGFSAARAVRAIHFSGASSVEVAVNWIVEHEEDPDADVMPLVPAGEGSKKPALTPEEAQAKAKELKEKARKKKEEEEARREREREKERIRVGKEIQEAKRVEEDQERKRIIQLRKMEKEEERRAREKILARLAEDKAERRRKLGLPPLEEPPAGAAAAPEEAPAGEPAPPAKKPLAVNSVTLAEQMRECLRRLKQAHKDDEAKVKRAFQTLLTFVGNVARSPGEEKYRRIRLTNAAFQERVGGLTGGVDFLELCGFRQEEGGEFLAMGEDQADLRILNTAGSELTSAINNPFFGIL